jgi:hypothetical protein
MSFLSNLGGLPCSETLSTSWLYYVSLSMNLIHFLQGMNSSSLENNSDSMYIQLPLELST